ncbi:hypothetical protein [Thalassobius vesicularis]|uniref:hypothetical protein n=1 Tax=Thalassobius vesicularis TaxID=1294297 RepID=UPI001454DB3F|nr:hypothetical protein [Thalassobius vesicularis]
MLEDILWEWPRAAILKWQNTMSHFLNPSLATPVRGCMVLSGDGYSVLPAD